MTSRNLVPSLAFLSVLCLCACEARRCRGEELESVFRGFVYVGEFAKGPLPIPKHEDRADSFPSSLLTGRWYVFHPNAPLATEEAALRLLPSRLQEAGFSIVAAPKSSGDFAVPTTGGALWEIQFRKAGCRGRVFNRFDPSLQPARLQWAIGSSDDYILEFNN